MSNNTLYNQDDEIDLKDLLRFFINKKLSIFFITFIFSLLSLVLALSLPNIYMSKSTLSAVSDEDSLSSKIESFSSFAPYGLGLSRETLLRSDEIIERIKSYDFFSRYFLTNIDLKNMSSVKSWDASSNTITYSKSFSENGKIPSNQEAYATYLKKISIKKDQKTSLITISAEHKSPFIAKKWVDLIIYNINESMREEDANTAKKAIQFLTETTKSTNIQSLNDSVNILLKNQMQILMLAASNEAYALKVIDPPFVPEKKYKPSRLKICIIGTIIGLLLSVLYSFIQYTRSDN